MSRKIVLTMVAAAAVALTPAGVALADDAGSAQAQAGVQLQAQAALQTQAELQAQGLLQAQVGLQSQASIPLRTELSAQADLPARAHTQAQPQMRSAVQVRPSTEMKASRQGEGGAQAGAGAQGSRAGDTSLPVHTDVPTPAQVAPDQGTQASVGIQADTGTSAGVWGSGATSGFTRVRGAIADVLRTGINWVAGVAAHVRTAFSGSTHATPGVTTGVTTGLTTGVTGGPLRVFVGIPAPASGGSNLGLTADRNLGLWAGGNLAGAPALNAGGLGLRAGLLGHGSTQAGTQANLGAAATVQVPAVRAGSAEATLSTAVNVPAPAGDTQVKVTLPGGAQVGGKVNGHAQIGIGVASTETTAAAVSPETRISAFTSGQARGALNGALNTGLSLGTGAGVQAGGNVRTRAGLSLDLGGSDSTGWPPANG